MADTSVTGVPTRGPELAGQTVVVIGGSAGMGYETALRSRTEGAAVVITGRDPVRLERAAKDLDAHSFAAFDATDPARLEEFFATLPTPIDHVMVTAGRPHYAPLLELERSEAQRDLEEHLLLMVDVARNAAGKVRPGGTLVFIGGTGGKRPRAGLGLVSTVTAASPALVRQLALDLAPVRVNLIAPGFVDTPLSASLLGDDLERRREQLRTTLPIGRVVGPADIAALAVHIMVNDALTGATFDIDGGQQLLAD